jgi:iron complex transport system substrate-binding protein
MDRLAAAKPDLILTQELCDVCAVSFGAVTAAVRELSGKRDGPAQVLSLEPTAIEGIFETILTVGEATGTTECAKAEVQKLRDRLDAVRVAMQGIAHRPTVAALEWLDPPFAPGHWVPEQIEIAGGSPVLGNKGKPSTRCDWDDVIHTQAECVVAMPCGYDLAGTVREFLNVAGLDVWRDLPATYLWQLYAVDATAYFSRPGPRAVDGVEILAGILHPDRWLAPGPEQALRVNDVVEARLRIDERRLPF